MRAMIPHNSIAIVTSGWANILDPSVRKLATYVIYAKEKETADRRYLIGESGMSTDLPEPDSAEIMSFERALSTAKAAKLDPEFIADEGVALLFPQGAICRVSYITDNPPVPVAGEQSAHLKISGDLVKWVGDNNSSFAAEGVQMNLTLPNGGLVDASGGGAEARLCHDPCYWFAQWLPREIMNAPQQDNRNVHPAAEAGCSASQNGDQFACACAEPDLTSLFSRCH
jgi:hypothetical protein